MTILLQQAFRKADSLSVEEQDVLASRLLSELSDEDEFDRKIVSSGSKLAELANEALAEHRAGRTKPLIADQL